MSNNISKHLLTVQEIAEICSVRPETIQWWTRCREIPFIKIGRVIRYVEADILRWIEGKKVDVESYKYR